MSILIKDFIPLSLYIHIPWCVKKCPYCDFNSYQQDSYELPEQDYVKRLIQDLETELNFIQGRSLQSIFIGGGTPSLFSSAAIHEVLTAVKTRIAFAPEIEITLEANPGAVEQQKFTEFVQAGVNRLSIGVQSFNDKHLKLLGRIHGSAEAIKAAELAQNLKVNFNLDLMYGLPQQSMAEALRDITTALALKPQHLSWYQLTLEPNTAFYNQPPKLPDEDGIADMQQQGHKLLSEHGFEQYEISAYAKKFFQSQHNLNYWEFGDYIGIGAGAHGKITQLSQQTIIRRWKTRSPKDYMSVTQLAGEKIIPAVELPFEFMMNALRLKAGVPLKYFEQRTGLSLAAIQPALQKAKAKELLVVEDNKIKPTALGYQYLNDLITLFMD